MEQKQQRRASISMLCRENENSYARDSSLIKILKIKNAQVHEIIVQTEKKGRKVVKSEHRSKREESHLV